MGTSKPSKLPPITELAQRVRDGEDSNQIAREYGITRGTLMNRFQVAGFSTTGLSAQDEARADLKAQLKTAKRTWLEPWMSEGVCRSVGVEPFYQENGTGARAVKQICQGCPVAQQCEDYVMDLERGWGLKHREGIWAGMTPLTRHRYEATWLKARTQEGAA